MMKRLAIWALLLAAIAGSAQALVGTRRALLSGGVAVVNTCGALSNVSIMLNFAMACYYGATLTSSLAISRTSTNGTATDLVPGAAVGFAYTQFANNTFRLTSGKGLLHEASATNVLLNSATPATQTTPQLSSGQSFTLSVWGSGSAQMSSGTGTGCGTGTATNGSAVNFTMTGTGTCTVTVTGSLNCFQVEAGGATANNNTVGSSCILTGASVSGIRGDDSITFAGSALSDIQGASFSIIASGGQNPSTNFPALVGTAGYEILGLYSTTTLAFIGNPNLISNAGTSYQSNPIKVGTSGSASGRALQYQATATVTDATASPTLTAPVYLGERNAGVPVYMYFKSVAIYNSALSASALSAAMSQIQ